MVAGDRTHNCRCFVPAVAVFNVPVAKGPVVGIRISAEGWAWGVRLPFPEGAVPDMTLPLRGNLMRLTSWFAR